MGAISVILPGRTESLRLSRELIADEQWRPFLVICTMCVVLYPAHLVNFWLLENWRLENPAHSWNFYWNFYFLFKFNGLLFGKWNIILNHSLHISVASWCLFCLMKHTFGYYSYFFQKHKYSYRSFDSFLLPSSQCLPYLESTLCFAYTYIKAQIIHLPFPLGCVAEDSLKFC